MGAIGTYALDVGSVLSYLVAVLVPALDALLPWLPSESVIIALGAVTAGSTDPRIGVLVVLAALGAFLGDNAAYLVGRRFGPAVDRRLFSGEKGARRRAWAERSLGHYGMRVIILCRFIPGGRTAVTLTCGVIGYPRRRFVTATAVGRPSPVGQLCVLPLAGGAARSSKDQLWIGLLLGLGLGLAVSVDTEVGRRVWQWQAAVPGGWGWPASGSARPASLGKGKGRPSWTTDRRRLG